MALGSRFVIRGKAAIKARIASTSREPLLFLYPQWSRKISSASDRYEHTRPDRSLNIGESFRDSPAQDGDGQPPDVFADPSGAASPTENWRASRFQHQTTPTAPSFHASEVHSSNEETQQKHEDTTELVQHEPSRTGDHLSSNITSDETTENKITSKWRIKKTQRRVRKILSTARHDNIQRERDLQRRKLYQEVQRLRRCAEIPNWREILGKMMDSTPNAGKWLNKPIRIIVPSLESELITGIDTNLWDLATPHGCSPSYRNRGLDAPSDVVYFDLSGPIIGVRAAIKDILKVHPTTSIMSNKPSESGSSDGSAAVEDSPPVRKSWVERRDPLRWDRHPAHLLKPEAWTKESFNEYVHYLTSALMTNHIHASIYRAGEDHIAAVINILLEVFNDPRAKQAISKRALNAAMSYLVKHNQILHARSLFVQMESIGFPMNTDTFNIMLRGAAKHNDLSNFHTLLNLMLKRNYTPDSQTFIAFMRAFDDSRIKKYILLAMSKLNLLNHKSTLKEACEQFVSEDFEGFLQEGKTEWEFLQHMDEKYGESWLSVSNGNRILKVLASKWLISRSWKFVLEMKKRDIEPDSISLNTILSNCKHMGNMEGAIEILKNWPHDAQHGIPRDELTYHCLFIMAVRLRMHNVARTIWQYACLNAFTTSWMRHFVYNSMRDGLGLLSTANRKQRRALRREKMLPMEGNAGGLIEGETGPQADDSTNAKKEDLDIESSTPANDIATQSECGPPNPNSLTRMSHRITGMFLVGIADIRTHPIQRWVSGEASEGARLIRSLVDIMPSTPDTVHLAEGEPRELPKLRLRDKLGFVREKLEKDQAVWREWEAGDDFVASISAAYEKDMEWRERDMYQDAMNLRWMSEQHTGMLIRKKRGGSRTVAWW
ncbi:hypothetical protein PVAG01_03770 [Phlyctema vagabunda]|uniref:Pentatricopeptide repeat-containing protein n=1 Tax=Phlyctema vagabunda TaxID=108571 RepID=A0ABR4PMC1_9HELO